MSTDKATLSFMNKYQNMDLSERLKRKLSRSWSRVAQEEEVQ